MVSEVEGEDGADDEVSEALEELDEEHDCELPLLLDIGEFLEALAETLGWFSLFGLLRHERLLELLFH